MTFIIKGLAVISSLCVVFILAYVFILENDTIKPALSIIFSGRRNTSTSTSTNSSIIIVPTFLPPTVRPTKKHTTVRPTQPAPKKHTTVLLTRNLKCKPNLDVLILITTHAWSGLRRRLVIRDTWAPYRPEKYNLKNNKTWQVFFVVGSKVKTLDAHRKLAETVTLRAEVARYGDVIEGDFEETFNNLGVKLQVGFEWSHLYCNAKYIQKTDDDVFLNTKNLLNFVSTLKPKGLYTGNIHWSDGVHRQGKYKVTTQEFPGNRYPPFASGATMIFTPDTIARLVGIFQKEKVFRLEDVYIGILINKLGIKPFKTDGAKKGFWEVYLFNEKKDVCTIYQRAIIRHIYFYSNQKEWCIYKLYDAAS